MPDPINRPESLLIADVEEMTQSQTSIFIKLYMTEELHRDYGIVEEDLPAAYRIMEKRIGQHPTARVTTGCKLCCASLCNSPAKAVMWAYTLCRIAEETELPVTITELAHRFPHGFPTEEAYRTTWDAQKNPGAPLGNLLDCPTTWRPETDA